MCRKDSASPRPDAQKFMSDIYSFLLQSVGFMSLYSSWYNIFDPFWEGWCICVFSALQWGWAYMRDPFWALYEMWALCKYWAEYLSKSESLDNSATNVWYFVLHLLANTLINCPFGKKSPYVLVGKKLDRKTFCSILRTREKKTRTCKKYLGNTWMGGVWV